MTALVEIAAGAWVRPGQQVVAVVAYPGRTVGTLTMAPSVKLYGVHGEILGWELDTLDRAKEWAGAIAKALNARETP